MRCARTFCCCSRENAISFQASATKTADQRMAAFHPFPRYKGNYFD